MLEQIQPHLQTIVVALISIATTVILGLLTILQKRINLWLASKTSVSDMELIHKVSAEAFALAESAFKTVTSQAKFNQAFNYASDRLAKAGIKVTGEEIKAAIEKAVLEHNTKTKASS